MDYIEKRELGPILFAIFRPFSIFQNSETCLLSYLQECFFKNKKKFCKGNSKQQKVILVIFITNKHAQNFQNAKKRYRQKECFFNNLKTDTQNTN